MRDQLPEGWVWSNLGEACQVILGQSPDSDTYNTEQNGLPFYQGKAEFGKLYPTPIKWCTSPRKIAEAGDVLISVRAPVGPTNLCQETSCIGRGLAALRPKSGMPTSYLLYYLRFIENEWDSKATGTTFKAITGDVLRNQEIPLPPLPEQERIVAKIEALFSQLDAGVAALRRIQAALKRYKASVLKAACEGRLVAQDPADEPAEALLRRLGKVPLVDDDLPALPEGWCWTDLSEIAKTIYRYPTFYGMEHLTEGVPVIRGEHINPEGTISHDWSNYWFVSAEISKGFPRTIVELYDLVMSVRGSVGKMGIVDDALIGAQVSPNCLRISLHKDVCSPLFLLYFLKSSYGQALIRKNVNATTIQTIKASLLSQISIPLPPLPEQKRIIFEIESCLSVATEVESIVSILLGRSNRLRQAILKRAFEGKL